MNNVTLRRIAPPIEWSANQQMPLLSFRRASRPTGMSGYLKSHGRSRPPTSGGGRQWPLLNRLRYISLVTATMTNSCAKAAYLRGMFSRRPT